jgi:hypothetical protein
MRRWPVNADPLWPVLEQKSMQQFWEILPAPNQNAASVALAHAAAALASKEPGGGAESYVGRDRSVAQTCARAKKKYVRATRKVRGRKQVFVCLLCIT